MPDYDVNPDDFPRKSGGDFQDSLYHDEEPEIQADDLPHPPMRVQPHRKRMVPYPQPRRRYIED